MGWDWEGGLRERSRGCCSVDNGGHFFICFLFYCNSAEVYLVSAAKDKYESIAYRNEYKMDGSLDRVVRLMGDRRVPAKAKYTENPTDITDAVFKDDHVWESWNEWKMPYWNVYRMGMSCTVVGNKKIFIGGEHEDYYDPNFCIYNDVIVLENNTIRVYGYPQSVFPPTDFHRVILIADHIWILGSLGYQKRRKTSIQVCRLNITTMQMELMCDMVGEAPPWMDFHKSNGNSCTLQSDGCSILVTSGKHAWLLDTRRCEWRRDPKVKKII